MIKNEMIAAGDAILYSGAHHCWQILKLANEARNMLAWLHLAGAQLAGRPQPHLPQLCMCLQSPRSR